MTIWHVQKLYTDKTSAYEVLPYDLFSTVHSTLKMKNGIKQTIKFLANSRCTKESAFLFCQKKNLQIT